MVTRTHYFGFPNAYFFFILFCLVGFSATAQVEPDFLAVVEENTATVKKSALESKKAAYYFRHFKKLSPSYTGYLIELAVSEEPLRRDFPLFQKFGNVHYRRFKSGKIAYYIIGKDFESRSSVKKFIKNVVVHQAPEARLVVKKK